MQIWKEVCSPCLYLCIIGDNFDDWGYRKYSTDIMKQLLHVAELSRNQSRGEESASDFRLLKADKRYLHTHPFRDTCSYEAREALHKCVAPCMSTKCDQDFQITEGKELVQNSCTFLEGTSYYMLARPHRLTTSFYFRLPEFSKLKHSAFANMLPEYSSNRCDKQKNDYGGYVKYAWET